MAKDPPQSAVTVRRTGGAYSLTKAFVLLDVSPSFGHALVKAGKIQVVRLGPGSPRVTDAEIERLLREGIKGAAYPAPVGKPPSSSPGRKPARIARGSIPGAP
jgi:hypothetical protein